MKFSLRAVRMRRAVAEIAYSLVVLVSFFVSRDLFTLLSLLYFTFVLISGFMKVV